MAGIVIRLRDIHPRRWARSVASAFAICISSFLAPKQLSAQNLPITPAVQRALRDSALVRQIPGRFEVKVRSADRRETQQERGAMEGHLRDIVSLLHLDPAFARPTGIDVNVQIETGITKTGTGARLISGIVKFFAWPFMVNGSRVSYNNALAAEFHVNDDLCATGNPVVPGSSYFLAGALTGDYHGFPTLDSIVVITHRAPPPCIPVSRAEYLNAMAHSMARATAIDPAEAAQAKREQDAALREMARTNPTAAAQERAQIAAIQHTTDSITASLATRYTTPLSRMSPAERSSPAYVVDGSCADDENACLVPPGTSGARMIVRANPAFFDTTRPTDAQVITLDLRHVLDEPNPPDPFIVALMSRALSQFDWDGLGPLAK